MGVSKDCCRTCQLGLKSLKTRSGFIINNSHYKPYMPRLTGYYTVDNDIIDGIKADFERWIRTIYSKPDSDISDHEWVDEEPEAGRDEKNLPGEALQTYDKYSAMLRTVGPLSFLRLLPIISIRLGRDNSGQGRIQIGSSVRIVGRMLAVQ